MQYITVDLRDRKQLYEQLIDNIRKLILSGEIRPGEKLPSVRALARELCINPNTIQKAYNELERQGVILTLPGRGSVVLAETDDLRKEQLARTRDAMKALAREAMSTGITEEAFVSMAAEVWQSCVGQTVKKEGDGVNLGTHAQITEETPQEGGNEV